LEYVRNVLGIADAAHEETTPGGKRLVIPRLACSLAGRRLPITLAPGQYDVHPNQIVQWKTQLQERATDLFATAGERTAATPDVKALHAKIGQLAMENDFLAGALGRIPDASAKR